MFIDIIQATVESGKGGDGCVSFRREKFYPKGGPDGGDGGKGGHIILKADNNLSTLMDLRYKKIYKAKKGQPGMGSQKFGKDGEDLIIKVPTGSIVRDTETDETLIDLTEDGQEFIVVNGGKGGKGNVNFKTSTNKTPRYAQYGQEGLVRHIEITLKLIADAGLVGFPNAGKSTLLSRLSNAKPKIANYPFTTLVPNLGIVKVADYESFVIADIPGLIEGAHLGKGLGHQFLRHVQRTKVLAFLIDITDENPKERYDVLISELRDYDDSLMKKPHIIILNKTDMADEELLNKDFGFTENVYFMSALTGENMQKIKYLIFEKIKEMKKEG